jgi:hypothetical protein
MTTSDEIRDKWLRGPLEGLPEPRYSFDYYFELYARREDLVTRYDSISGNPNYADEADRNSELKALAVQISQLISEIEGERPTGTPIWEVKEPERDGPYNHELVATLKSLDKSQPRPKPLEILAIWRANPPRGIKVNEKSFSFLTYTGERKEADLDALRKRIASYTKLL